METSESEHVPCDQAGLDSAEGAAGLSQPHCKADGEGSCSSSARGEQTAEHTAKSKPESRSRPLTPSELGKYWDWNKDSAEEEEEEKLRAQWETLSHMLGTSSSSGYASGSAGSSPDKKSGHRRPSSQANSRHRNGLGESCSTFGFEASLRGGKTSGQGAGWQSNTKPAKPVAPISGLHSSQSCGALPGISTTAPDNSKPEMAVPYSRKSASVSSIKRKLQMVTTISRGHEASYDFADAPRELLC